MFKDSNYKEARKTEGNPLELDGFVIFFQLESPILSGTIPL